MTYKPTKKPFVRTAYNFDSDAVSLATGFSSDLPSLTQQQFKEECDINNIALRFGLTGQMPVGVRMPTYGDFTGVEDYQSALDAIMSAERSFMQLPPQVRERFGNDPQAFVAFCSDPANKDEAQALGLVDAPTEPPKAPEVAQLP